MSFILILICSMLVADLGWWAWAYHALSGIPHSRNYRIALHIFMAVQVFSLVWVIAGRFFSERTDELLPKFLLASVFLWHFILLPISVILASFDLLARLSALIAGIWLVKNPIPPVPGMTRRQLLRAAAIAAPPMATALTTGISLRQLNDFRVRRFELALSQLPLALDGLKIVQVSDIHVGSFTSGPVLRRIVETTNALKGDLVLLTGDLINHSLSDLAPGLDLVRKMDARFGVFMCEGNHDLSGIL